MPDLHPYRSPGRSSAALEPAPRDPLRRGLVASQFFLAAWSLVRVGVCALRGLDLEGCIALVVLAAAVSSLTHSWSQCS